MWWNKRKKSENDIQKLVEFETKIKSDVKNQLWQEMESRLAEFAKKEERAAKVKDGWVWLERLPKILPLASLAAFVIGAIIVYSYLYAIDSVSLFAQVMSSPSSLVSILFILLILLIFIFGIPFYAPYDFASSVNKIRKDSWEGHLLCILGLIALLSTQIFIVNQFDISTWKNDSIPFSVYLIIIVYLIGFITISMIFYSFIIKFNKNKIRFSFFEFLKFTVNYGRLLLFSSTLLWFSIIRFSSWFDSPIWFWVTLVVIYIVNIFPSFALVGVGEVGENPRIIWGFPIFFVGILGFTMMTMPGSKVDLNLLHKLGYIESHSQARLYLLDKRFIDWTVLPEQQDGKNVDGKKYLLQLRERFYPICKMESENERKICEDAIKKWGEYNNALYGYMMWNLGETKIFCPNNSKLPRYTKEFKNESFKCLKIKGEYLYQLPAP